MNSTWGVKGEKWKQQAKLVARDAVADDRFGEAIFISGEISEVGTQFDEVNHNGNTIADAGSAYTFHRVHGNWSGRDHVFAFSDPIGNTANQKQSARRK